MTTSREDGFAVAPRTRKEFSQRGKRSFTVENLLVYRFSRVS